ncbi:MAG: 1-acyl-sn-glycerol-3-phosphate acyltransferase [Saprospiraceae bacterium]|nr:1-acyl-sn-glycerol-3-phosphate acyltransferase [Saprospiraceae bacterium]
MLKRIFLYCFYQFARGICALLNFGFFKEVAVRNKQYLHTALPQIISSHHPNAFMDVSIVGVHSPYTLYMLANAGLFKSKFANWFFNTFYCIPIERPQDTNGRPINNVGNFRRSTQHLTNGGVLFIASEGTSIFERRLKPLKTGMARIALIAERENNYQLGLSIIPMCLHYTAPTEFRSSVLLNVGKPMRVADWQELNESDNYAAVNQLTDAVERVMRDLLIHTDTAEQAILLEQVETLVQNDKPLNVAGVFDRTQTLLRWLQQLSAEQYSTIEKSCEKYFSTLKQLQLSDVAFAEKKYNVVRQRILLVVLFPLYVIAWLMNAPPCYLANYMVKALGFDVVYEATIKAITGLVFFIIYYLLQIIFIYKIFLYKFALLYLLLLIPMGLFAWWYRAQWKLYAAHRQKKRAVTKEHYDDIIRLRRDIIHQLPDSVT